MKYRVQLCDKFGLLHTDLDLPSSSLREPTHGEKAVTTKHFITLAAMALTLAIASSAGTSRAQVQNGDVITPATA
jgi:hypothetical protein